MIVIVVVVMIMRVSMIVIMMMVVSMMVVMTVAVMVVTLQMRLAARQPRVLAEHQRLDGHRHGHRRQPDAAEIDIVEIP